MRKFCFLLALAWASLSACAQATWHYDGVATSGTYPTMTPVPNAVVTICKYPAVPATGSVCTNTVGSTIVASATGAFTFPSVSAPATYSYSVVDATGKYVGTYTLYARYFRPALVP